VGSSALQTRSRSDSVHVGDDGEIHHQFGVCACTARCLGRWREFESHVDKVESAIRGVVGRARVADRLAAFRHKHKWMRARTARKIIEAIRCAPSIFPTWCRASHPTCDAAGEFPVSLEVVTVADHGDGCTLFCMF